MSSDSPPSKTPQEMLEEAKSSLSKTFSSDEGAMKGIEETLRSSIKSGVSTANAALASLEKSTEKVRKPIVTSLHSAGKEGKYAAQEASHFYSVRHEYAPHIIGGATVLGGLVGLRRGRVPAAVVGSFSGFFSYLAVYQVDFSRLPDHVFGKK